MKRDDEHWKPFRPGTQDLNAIAEDVAEIPAIQQKLLANHSELHCPDRVAHQYQIAGGKVMLKMAEEVPAPLHGVGLFHSGAEALGIGRISTGLGTPHIETNPDFLGIRLAFQTPTGQRVDFLAINHPAAPTDNHKQFVDVLHATAESAGAEIPVVGKWGEYNIADLALEQCEFGFALAKRMGLRAIKTLRHLTAQTLRTSFSSTAYQAYWTGIEETGGVAGKFTLVPVRDENHRPEFRPGERHLSEEWRERQRQGDIEFRLYWIPFLDEQKTPMIELTEPWDEGHKQLAATVWFPKMVDPSANEARLWAILASEMGANPGNWIHDKANTIPEPCTEFGVARKLAYQMSQQGRGVLEPRWYESVFSTGQIGPDLAAELTRRQSEKDFRQGST